MEKVADTQTKSFYECERSTKRKELIGSFLFLIAYTLDILLTRPFLLLLLLAPFPSSISNVIVASRHIRAAINKP
jgi:hypothetical protein